MNLLSRFQCTELDLFTVYGVWGPDPTRQLDDNDFGKSSKSASTSSAKRSQSKKRKLAVIMVDGVETEVRYMD